MKAVISLIPLSAMSFITCTLDTNWRSLQYSPDFGPTQTLIVGATLDDQVLKYWTVPGAFCDELFSNWYFFVHLYFTFGNSGFPESNAAGLGLLKRAFASCSLIPVCSPSSHNANTISWGVRYQRWRLDESKQALDTAGCRELYFCMSLMNFTSFLTQFRNFGTPLITFERIELSASNLAQT